MFWNTILCADYAESRILWSSVLGIVFKWEWLRVFLSVFLDNSSNNITPRTPKNINFVR